MEFYTDVLDVFVAWLYRTVADLHGRLRQHDDDAGYYLSPVSSIWSDAIMHTQRHSSLSPPGL